MAVNLDKALAFIFVMLRMTGLFVFNPIFSRSNVPSMIKTALAFLISIIITTSRTFDAIPDPNLYEFIFMAVKELGVGFFAGLIMRMFLSVFIIGGEIIDMQIGVGMSKVFDPASNSSISLSSSFFNIFFTMLFFVTNNHLTLIYMTSQTFDIIPIGMQSISLENLYEIPMLLSSIFIFAVKLCVPIVIIEVIATFAVGLLMKIIPSINVFVVSIQLKLFIGVLVMLLLVPAFMGFFENMLVICFENIQGFWMNYLQSV